MYNNEYQALQVEPIMSTVVYLTWIPHQEWPTPCNKTTSIKEKRKSFSQETVCWGEEKAQHADWKYFLRKSAPSLGPGTKMGRKSFLAWYGLQLLSINVFFKKAAMNLEQESWVQSRETSGPWENWLRDQCTQFLFSSSFRKLWCPKMNYWGKRPAWLNLISGEKNIYQLWKKDLTTPADYRDVVRLHRNKIRSIKAQTECNLASAVNDNRTRL